MGAVAFLLISSMCVVVALLLVLPPLLVLCVGVDVRRLVAGVALVVVAASAVDWSAGIPVVAPFDCSGLGVISVAAALVTQPPPTAVACKFPPPVGLSTSVPADKPAIHCSAAVSLPDALVAVMAASAPGE